MKQLINEFKRNGYNVRITKDELFIIKITKKSNMIMYTGSFDDYNHSTIDEIFEELRLN